MLEFCSLIFFFFFLRVTFKQNLPGLRYGGDINAFSVVSANASSVFKKTINE